MLRHPGIHLAGGGYWKGESGPGAQAAFIYPSKAALSVPLCCPGSLPSFFPTLPLQRWALVLAVPGLELNGFAYLHPFLWFLLLQFPHSLLLAR